MNVPLRLATFALAALAAFAIGLGVGNAAGPFDDAPAQDAPTDGHDWHDGR